MKNKLIIIISVLLIGLCCLCVIQHYKYERLQERYEQSINNLKAYNIQLEDDCIAFQLTVDLLLYIKDSSIRSLDSMRNELRIKDNKIKQMSKTKQTVYIHDSIIFYDTLFHYHVSVDTCISDKWRQICMEFEYPNYVSVQSTVNLETDCLLHVKRETVNPPCKTWIGRLFLKKHDVYHATIVEHNPYANVTETKLIIIKD